MEWHCRLSSTMINTCKRSEMRFLDWFLGYILSNAIFSNIGLSMALLAHNHSPPCPSSLNHVWSRMNRKFSLKSTATDSLSHYLPMDKLEKLCSYIENSSLNDTKICLSGSVSLWCGGDRIFSSSLPMAFRCLLHARHWIIHLKLKHFPFPKIC